MGKGTKNSPCSNLAVKIHAANEENNSFLLLAQKNNCLFFSKCESHKKKKVPSKTLSAACGHCFRFLFTFHKVTHALLFAANSTQNYSGAPETKYMASNTTKKAIKISTLVSWQVDHAASNMVSVSGLCYWQ